MPVTPRATLTKVELSALCDVAARAWSGARRGAEQVSFSWRETRYLVSHAAAQIRVTKLDGTEVARRDY